jgi:hypothetical protein
MKQPGRVNNTYVTTPQLTRILNDGYRLIKDYGSYTLFEKVVDGKVLYRECFHNFSLYGTGWASTIYTNTKAGLRCLPKKR